jgi:hypothetical protein
MSEIAPRVLAFNNGDALERWRRVSLGSCSVSGSGCLCASAKARRSRDF